MFGKEISIERQGKPPHLCCRQRERTRPLVKSLIISCEDSFPSNALNFRNLVITENFGIDDVDGEGRTALYRASAKKHFSLVKLLLSLGADPTKAAQSMLKKGDHIRPILLAAGE